MKGTSQEHLSSELQTLSPPLLDSGGGDSDGGGYKNVGEDAMAEEAPLDSLLASEAEARVQVKPKGHQASRVVLVTI